MGQKIDKTAWFACMVFVWTFVSFTAWADDNTDILPIKSVPGINAPDITDKKNLLFSGKGTIQRIGNDEAGEKLIVIDDRLMYLTSGIRYFNADAEPVSFSLFYKDKRVGYVFNDKRHITALYLIVD